MNMINNKDNQTEETVNNQQNTLPDDSSGLYVRGHVKISDPDTGEILVHTAD